MKPIFKALANPGLGNPHTPYEDELMVAGVKPVAMMLSGEISSKMQEKIVLGQIVHIGSHENVTNYRIFCLNNHVDDIRYAAKILSKFWGEQTDLPFQHDQELIASSFYLPPQSRWLEKGNAIAQAKLESIYYNNQHLNLDKPFNHLSDLLDKGMPALVPIFYNSNKQKEFYADLDNAFQDEQISAVDFSTYETLGIYAQKDKIEQGKELFDLCFMNGKNSSGMTEYEYHERVGQLLGFTVNDIAWCLGEKYQNPFIGKILYITTPLRKWARKEVMLMDSEEFGENIPKLDHELT